MVWRLSSAKLPNESPTKCEIAHVGGPTMSGYVQVFGRRQQGGSAGSTDRRPKSAKARSREVGHRPSSERYEDLMLAPSSMMGGMLTGFDLQAFWRAFERHQRAIRGLMDAIGSRETPPAGKEP